MIQRINNLSVETEWQNQSSFYWHIIWDAETCCYLVMWHRLDVTLENKVLALMWLSRFYLFFPSDIDNIMDILPTSP